MPSFTPSNPDFVHLVRASFAQQGLMQHLGATLAHVEAGDVLIQLPFSAALTQQHGLFHAGAVVSVVDSACGYAALTLMPPGSEVLSVEFKVNLLAPARGVRLLARGRVLRPGRTLTVCQGEAVIVTDGGETMCATMLATMIRRSAG